MALSPKDKKKKNQKPREGRLDKVRGGDRRKSEREREGDIYIYIYRERER